MSLLYEMGFINKHSYFFIDPFHYRRKGRIVDNTDSCFTFKVARYHVVWLEYNRAILMLLMLFIQTGLMCKDYYLSFIIVSILTLKNINVVQKSHV